jgi:hypothetical protein
MERLRPVVCPHCGKTNDAHTNFFDGERVPPEGAVSLCAMCGHWAMFSEGGLRKLTGEEQAVIDADNRAQDLLKAWRATAFEWSLRRK